MKILVTNSIAAVTMVWSDHTDSTVKPLNWRNGHKSPVPPYQKKSTITKVRGTSRFAPNRCEKGNLEVPLTFVHWVLHNIAVMVCLEGVAAVGESNGCCPFEHKPREGIAGATRVLRVTQTPTSELVGVLSQSHLARHRFSPYDSTLSEAVRGVDTQRF